MNMFKSTIAQTPEEYISLLPEDDKKEILALHEFIKQTVPDLKPYIISGMIGYGTYHYKYASGREGDWCMIGLAKQKNYVSIYTCGTDGATYIAENYKHKLPKANIGKSCIRIKKIDDIDLTILKEILLRTEKSFL